MLQYQFVLVIDQCRWPTTAVAASVLLLLLGLGRWAPRTQGPLIAVFAATSGVVVLSLQDKGIEVVRAIPAQWPATDLSPVPPSDVVALLLPAVGIAIVAFSDNVLTARARARGDGDEIDASPELRALGVANDAPLCFANAQDFRRRDG